MGFFGTQDNSRILPGGTYASGYGGRPYGSQDAADKSRLRDIGVVTDRDTGRVGTPSQLYDQYRAEGRDTSGLFRQFGR